MTARTGCSAAVVAVAGPDGAGKSTLTRLLAERLREAGLAAQRVDRWDITGNPRYPAATCLTPEARQARSCAARMSTVPRLLFLLWASTLALTDRDDDFAEQIVLIDGYWMKHAASEIAYGCDPAWVEAVAAGLPRPDLIVYLRLDPEVAWRRKEGKPLPYECGMDMSCGHASFLGHQGAIQAVLDRWASQEGWTVLDATEPSGALADQIMREVLTMPTVAALSDAR